VSSIDGAPQIAASREGGTVSDADLSIAGPDDMSAGEVRDQLARILASAEFDATDRERRFLSYVVDETLAKRSDRIKAYSIAVEVFGRDASFDPQSDPIVRIEAGHLRRALERYYLTAGLTDPILVTIPKGGYVPSFSRRPQQMAIVAPDPVPTAPPVAVAKWRPSRRAVAMAALFVAMIAAGSMAWLRTWSGSAPDVPDRPTLLVQPFDDLTGTEASAAIARGLLQEVVGQLSKFKDLRVLEAGGKPDERARSRFALAGSVNVSDDAFRLRVRLINGDDGSVLWADSYDGAWNVGELVDAQAEIARNVATTLAQTYGVIFQADAARSVNNPPDDWAAYSCTLSFYAYRAEMDLEKLDGVRDCLEKAVARYPNYATAWGLLAQADIDAMRFHYPFDPATAPAAIERALAAAKRAVELDPFNVRGLQSQMFALYFSKDIDAALAVGKRAMTINPNDTELMGEYGYRLALSGKWAEGCPLVKEARERNPGPLAYYETALALCAYFSGDPAQAAVLIRRAILKPNSTYHVIAAAIFAEAGQAGDAERERAWLVANAPALVKNVRQEAAIRFLRPQDAEFFLGSLRKAGLDVED